MRGLVKNAQARLGEVSGTDGHNGPVSDDPARYVPFPAFNDWTGHANTDVVGDYVRLLDAAKAASTPDQLAHAVRVATRYAAVDTGAIEGLYTVDRGFTRTIATEAASWEVALQQRGESVRRSIEDALNGYEYVLDAVTGNTPLSDVWIRTLHEILCASQTDYTVYTSQGPQRQQLPKGVYKTFPNSPTNASTGRVHHYAPSEDTPAEMGRLIAELRSDAFLAAHPVTQAAYAHYAFVCVHPFADGNGRVSRALASVFLYRNPGVPLVVFADQHDQYIDALEAADHGDHQHFQSFIEQRALDTITLVELQIRAQPNIKDALTRLQLDSLHATTDGVEHAEALAARLAQLAQDHLGAAMTRVSSDGLATFELGHARGLPFGSPTEGYRFSPDAEHFQIGAASSPPLATNVRSYYAIEMAKPGHPGPDFQILGSRVGPLGVWLREIYPHETQLLGLKLETWADAEVGYLVDALATQHHEVLRQAGYLSGP